ncbi:MAG: SDR family oxidoreductase [Candidatus Pelethousia sp.]|nr:SDR family oxidoreductase [Candidatus Pelethousia sp.]
MTKKPQNDTYRIPLDMQIRIPPQHQDTQPGNEQRMCPQPAYDNRNYRAGGKLNGDIAIVTGGDSGIGRAVALLFAKEGADVLITYFTEGGDAEQTKAAIESYGKKCVVVKADLRQENASQTVMQRCIEEYGKLDILVNNIAVQYPQNSIEDITQEQLRETFDTNILSCFFMIKAALPHLKSGASIINTASVTAYHGNKTLLDYSATKGALVSLTRSLSLSLIGRGIRVNGVAPGPVWTPLIPSSFSEQEVASFGFNVPMGRAAQPFELAPAYVYLACDDSAYMSGQILHVNGGTIVDS